MPHADHIHWIKTYLLNEAIPAKTSTEKLHFKAISQFLESSDNLLEVLNALEPALIAPFIQAFLRPFDESIPYNKLCERMQSGNATLADTVCHALVTHDISDCDTDTLQHNQYEVENILNPMLQRSISLSIRLADNKYGYHHAQYICPELAGGYLNLALGYFPGIDFSYTDLSHANLEMIQFYEKKMQQTRLDRAVMPYARLGYSDFTGSSLTNTNLTFAYINHSTFINTSFKGATLSSSSIGTSDLTRACFNEANLEYAEISQSTLQHASLCNANANNLSIQHSNLSDTRIIDSSLINTRFSDCNLANTWMVNSALTNAVITDCRLEDAILDGASCKNAHFSHCNLARASLRHADLSHAVFDNVILIGAKIQDTRFNKTQLTHTHFFSANSVKCATAELTDTLNTWYEQIKNHPDRRQLRKWILDDLLAKARGLTPLEKKALYNKAFFHPLFGHTKPSLRGGINQLFKPSPTHHPEMGLKSSSQKKIADALLPKSPRLHLDKTHHGFKLTRR